MIDKCKRRVTQFALLERGHADIMYVTEKQLDPNQESALSNHRIIHLLSKNATMALARESSMDHLFVIRCFGRVQHIDTHSFSYKQEESTTSTISAARPQEM